MRQLIWFRTDLRLQDNTALAAAMRAGPTVAVFLLSPGQWQAHDDAPSKVDFWLRNRLCMIVAMFLTKNLLIDWREGERFFMRHLIDGDLAANNGGWQWSASTGTDSAPYFRIFNPISQSEKFDPEGRFIRHWLPELAGLNNKYLHNPVALTAHGGGLFGALDYPRPIVDLSSSRARALAAFKHLPTLAPVC